jgi:hypothetical protein
MRPEHGREELIALVTAVEPDLLPEETGRDADPDR